MIATARYPLLMLGFYLMAQPVASQTAESDLQERKELHPKGSSVKLRLLTKPFSKIYKDRACKEDAVASVPQAFSVMHVIQVPSSATSRVYEVADGTGLFLGYMLEADVVPWKQALCLQF